MPVFASQTIAVSIAVFVLTVFAAGCCRQPSGTPPTQANAASSPAWNEPRPTSSSTPRGAEPRHPAQPPKRTARRLPSLDAECGHAVAFAGFSTTADGDAGGTLFYHDPGDNILAGVVHSWDARPGSSAVICGTRRPIIVLAGAGAFTVMGAAAITPLPPAEAEGAIEVPDPSMPDLSQNIDGRQNGLCGPTSAADVLYAISGRRPRVLEGYVRGPAADAEDDVRRILLGLPRGESLGGLASAMQMTDLQKGTTPVGLSEGLLGWLDATDPGVWTGSLVWLDDMQRPAQEQLRFFQTLAAGQRRGGGAVLLLWPGSEFADGSVAEVEAKLEAQADGGGSGRDRPAATAAAAGFPEESDQSHSSATPPSATPKGFEGGKTKPDDIAKAVRTAKAEMSAAREAFDSSHWDKASDALKRVVAAAGPHAMQSDECFEVLNEASGLAERLDQARPHGTPDRHTRRRTQFD